MTDKKFKRLKSEEERTRKKKWEEKVIEVTNSYKRAAQNPIFYETFYKNLFFLKPELEEYFVNTKSAHQKIVIQKGVEHALGFLEKKTPKEIHRQNILRLSDTHAKKNLNIHPHHYYYWIDAMVLTLKEHDSKWYSDLEYYTRECLFFPISFMISRYH